MQVMYDNPGPPDFQALYYLICYKSWLSNKIAGTYSLLLLWWLLRCSVVHITIPVVDVICPVTLFCTMSAGYAAEVPLLSSLLLLCTLFTPDMT